MGSLRKVFSALTLLALVATAVPLAVAQQPAGSDKIEEALLDQLATEGTADFIVHFADQADLSPAYSMGWQERGEFVVRTLARTARLSQARAQAYLKERGLAYHTFIAGNELYVWAGDLAAANSLAAMPEVASIRATRVYQIPVPAQKPPEATFSWGILDTNADDFWASFGMQGDGIVVANIDTGVDYTHIALNANYKCLANPSDPACWYDPGSQDCTGPGGGPCDAWPGIYHGTHTMGTMAADDDPGLQYTVGMAPNAQWIACLGCPFGGCPDFDLNECADWMLAPGGDPANRPHVVNNSWGGWGCDPFYLAQVQAWRAAGIFPAFSAGNNYDCNSLGSPGDYQESFASAAHDVNRVIADFSSKGPSCYGHDPYTKPNISAPGVDVMSAMPGDAWQLMSGTSMASPHSAGAVALLWSCNPSLIGQIDQTFEILQDNADPPPAGGCGAPPDGEGNYTYGYGYLNVYQAGLLWCGETGWLNGHVHDADTGDPIAEATVTAVRYAGGTVTTLTDAEGYYSRTVMVGTYDVTAGKYGYLPETVSGVEVTTDTVTTVNFSLTAAPQYAVYGTVTDALVGWPLYARIDIDGYPYSPVWTDPESGYYSVTLAAGIAYTFHVAAWVPGYIPEDRVVGPLAGDQEENFALDADADSCSAPGYHPDCFYFENFESDDGGFAAYGTNSTWEWGAPTSGPGAAHSGQNAWATNLAGNYNDDEDSYLESPDIDLSSLAGQGVLLSWWQWLQTEYCCDFGEVQVSNDGGGSWTTVYGPARGDVDLGWTRHQVILGSSYAVSNFRVRFHLYTDGSVVYPGFYIDDICIVPTDPPVTLFFDDFEAGYANWSMDGLWNAEDEGDTCGSSVAPFPSSSHDAYYGLDGVCTYNNGASNYGYLSMVADVDLTGAGYALLNFWSYEATECGGGNCGYDVRYVEISTDGGSSWVPVWGSSGPEYSWYRATADLSPFAGEQVRVRFYFDTYDDIFNDYFGWMVDDVEVVAGAGGAIPCVPGSGGLVVGNVYDENTSAGLVGALVESDVGNVALTQPTPDDPAVDDGFYTLFVPVPPTPHDLTATMTGGYGPDTETVAVPLSDTVGQDFYLPAGFLDTDPDTMAVTLDWGMSTTLPLTLSNLGGLPAFFELMELNRGFQPMLAGQGRGEWLQRGEAVSQRSNRNTDAVVQPGIYRYEAKYPSQLDILVCSDSCAVAPPNTCPEIALQNLGQSYTLYYGDWVGCASALGSGLYDVAFIDNSCFFPSDSLFTAIEAFINAGGRAIVNSFDMDAFPGNPLWATAGVVWSSDVSMSPPPPVYRWEPDHPAVSGWPSDPLQFDDNYIDDGDKIDALGSASMLAGYTAVPGAGEGAFAIRNDNAVIVSSFCIDNLAFRDDDGDGVVDCAEVWQGAMSWLFAPSSDVPWLSEYPISGTLAAADSLVIDVTFDAGVPEVIQPGYYYATLNVANDTPYGTLPVPVTMTVLPRADMGKVMGYVTDNCTGGPVEATVDIAGGDPITQTTSDPDSGYYQAWLVEGTYDFSFSAPGYLAQSIPIQVTAGQTTTQDVLLVPDRPCIAVDPDSFEVWVLTGTQKLRSQTLTNNGGQTLEYEYREVEGGYIPPAGQMGPLPVYTPPILIASSPGGYFYTDAGLQALPDSGAYVPMAPARYAGPNSLVFYGDRGAFDADWPGLPVEGWENTLVPPGSVQACPGPWDSTTNNACFAPGGILDGIRIQVNPDPNGDLVVLTQGFLGVLSVVAGPNTFTDDFDILFLDEGVAAAGMDILNPLIGAPGTLDVYIYGAGDVLLGQTQVVIPPGVTGAFFGVASDSVPITRIYTVWASGDGELVDNVAFGGVIGGDVPWVWEEPVSGTVPAGTSFDEEIGFTSYYTEEPTGTVVHLPLGTYTATLRIVNNDPVAKTQRTPLIMHIVDEFITPTAGFASNSPVCLGDEMVFTNTTEPGVPPINTYEWDFGDGITSTLENPTHRYADAGTFTVTLEACNIEGQCDTASAVVEVLPLPVAGFTWTADFGVVTFTNLSANATSYQWTFGDGGTSTETNPVHVYTATGSYTVTLWATGDCGTDDAIGVVQVALCQNADIITYTAAVSGCVVTFGAEVVGTEPIDWWWDFGPFGTFTETSPVVDFSATGTYTGTLEVWNCAEGYDFMPISVDVSCAVNIYLPLIVKGAPLP